MTDLDLFAVLDRATDGIDPADSPQHAALSALSRARVVRNRRRGLVAGVVAAVVVAVVLVTGVHGLDRSTPPITPSPTVPEMPDSAVQNTWDPRTATSLPPRATVLPARIEPPADAGPLPLSGPALLVLSDGGNRLDLLAADGTWAAMKAPSGSSYVTSLSDDGTMIANAGPRGVFVTDVRDGTWRRLDVPPGPPSCGPTSNYAGLARGHAAARPAGGLGLGILDVGGATGGRHLAPAGLVSGLALVPTAPSCSSGPGRRPMIREVATERRRGPSMPIRWDGSGCRWPPTPGSSAGVGDPAGGPADGPRRRPRARAHRVRRRGLPADRRHEVRAGGRDRRVSATVCARWPGWTTSTLLLDHSTSLGRPWSLVAWDVDTGELSLVSSGASGRGPGGGRETSCATDRV